MSDYTIFHNPKCSKSRATLELLFGHGVEPEIILYLEEALEAKLLADTFKALGKEPKDVLRTKEKEYKSLNIDFNNAEEVIAAIIKTPKILERPIIVMGNKAVIGRPPENVLELF